MTPVSRELRLSPSATGGRRRRIFGVQTLPIRCPSPSPRSRVELIPTVGLRLQPGQRVSPEWRIATSMNVVGVPENNGLQRNRRRLLPSRADSSPMRCRRQPSRLGVQPNERKPPDGGLKQSFTRSTGSHDWPIHYDLRHDAAWCLSEVPVAQVSAGPPTPFGPGRSSPSENADGAQRPSPEPVALSTSSLPPVSANCRVVWLHAAS